MHADVAADGVTRLQDRLPFADGDDRLWRREREQLAKPPNPAEIERIAAILPAGLEVAQRSRHRDAVPVVAHVEQPAARVAGHPHLVDRILAAAVRSDADLASKLGKIGFGGN